MYRIHMFFVVSLFFYLAFFFLLERGDMKRERSTSASISEFHSLLKEIAKESDKQKRAVLQEHFEQMGGLKAYQKVSNLGESFGQFDTSVWVLQELKKRNVEKKTKMLDVGCLKSRYHDIKNIDCDSIDLYSDDKRVQQVDFFDFVKTNKKLYDVVLLCLVLNFVPKPEDRGRMLEESAKILKTGGLCLIILPNSCISNSRYFKFKYLDRILERIGLSIKSYQTSEKLFFCVCEKTNEIKKDFEMKALYHKRKARGGENRNNFYIVLPQSEQEKEKEIEFEEKRKEKKRAKLEEAEQEKPEQEKPEVAEVKRKWNSNTRKRARKKKMKEMQEKEAQKKEEN